MAASYVIAEAESDIQRHFLVSAPSVNAMMQTLTKKGFISRVPGVARSIQLRVPAHLLSGAGEDQQRILQLLAGTTDVAMNVK